MTGVAGPSTLELQRLPMIIRHRVDARFTGVAAAVLVLTAAATALVAQYSSSGEHPAIAYSKSAPTDAVARLQESVERGDTVLEFDPDRGDLPAVLRALKVPVSSQSLVFSRTSLQVDRIAPWTPRALYFSDQVYVGWAQNAPIMEIASVDPKLGAVFYTVTQEPGTKPAMTRQNRTCLQCHDSASSTGGVPGFIMRSTIADRHGYPVPSRTLARRPTRRRSRSAGAGGTSPARSRRRTWAIRRR